MNFTTSIFLVHATQALDRQFWFELNHFVTLALHYPMAERQWLMQASGTRKPKKAEPQNQIVFKH